MPVSAAQGTSPPPSPGPNRREEQRHHRSSNSLPSSTLLSQRSLSALSPLQTGDFCTSHGDSRNTEALLMVCRGEYQQGRRGHPSQGRKRSLRYLTHRRQTLLTRISRGRFASFAMPELARWVQLISQTPVCSFMQCDCDLPLSSSQHCSNPPLPLPTCWRGGG